MKATLPAALAAALLAACSVASTAVEPAVATQQGEAGCAGGESVVFACATGPDQGVALCGSHDATRIRYIESGGSGVVWPQTGAATAGSFRSGTLMYSGGGGAYLRFDREGFVHTVYTGIGRGWEKAGVLVQEDGRTVRGLTCRDEVTSLIGPELFERASIPADDTGFEIP